MLHHFKPGRFTNVKDLPLLTHLKTNEIFLSLKLQENSACSILIEVVEMQAFTP